MDCDLSNLNSWDLCGSFVCGIAKKLKGRKNKAHLKLLTTKINDSAQTNLTASSTKCLNIQLGAIHAKVFNRLPSLVAFTVRF